MLATKYLRKKSIKITNSVVTVGINIWGYILPCFLYICIGKYSQVHFLQKFTYIYLHILHYLFTNLYIHCYSSYKTTL